MNFDEVLHLAGDIGLFQIIVLITIGLFNVSGGRQSTAHVFYAADMDHWCKVDRLKGLPFELQKHIAIPMVNDSSGQLRYSRCQMYDLNYTQYDDEKLLTWNRNLSSLNKPIIDCLNNAWTYDQSNFVSTAVSKFNLVCHRDFLVPLLNSAYIFGMFFGVIISGALSDRYGRHRVLLGAKVCEIVLVLSASLSPVFELYIVLRFLVGSMVLASYTVSFVTVVEMFGTKYRAKSTLAIFGSVGMIVLTMYVQSTREFVIMQWLTVSALIVLIAYIWYIPESPRWLYSKGRYEEALIILRKMAAVNGKSLPSDISLEADEKLVSKRNLTLIDLIKHPHWRWRTLKVTYLWLTSIMVFYALSLNAGKLAGDIFLNNYLSGIVEVPGYIFIIFGLEYCDRKYALIAFFIIACLGMYIPAVLIFYPDLAFVSTYISLASKLGITMATNLVYIYTAELFPTSVRNVAVGVSSMCSRVGAMVSPQLSLLGSVWPPLPFVLFGTICFLAIFVTMALPETRGKSLPEFIQNEDGQPSKTNLTKLDMKLKFMNIKQRILNSKSDKRLSGVANNIVIDEKL